MMERLTRRTKLGVAEPYIRLSSKSENEEWLRDVVNKLAEYEDLEEQGLLLRLPVPIRTGWSKYYWIDEEDGEIIILNDNGYRIFKPTNDLTVYEIDGYDFPYEAFGKTVFLTEAEAEAKLKETESE